MSIFFVLYLVISRRLNYLCKLNPALSSCNSVAKGAVSLSRFVLVPGAKSPWMFNLNMDEASQSSFYEGKHSVSSLYLYVY